MRAADSRGHAWRNAGRTALLRHGSATGPRPTLCCRIVLMALCVTCSFAPAWAATFVAAKATCIHGRPACAFVRQSRPKAPLREPFLPLLAPPPCRIGRRRRERSEHGERSEGAVRLCLPRMVTSDERKKVSGGASLHTPLTRRASGGQGYVQHYSATERGAKKSLTPLFRQAK